MQGRRFPSPGFLHSIPRAVPAIVMAAAALLAALPQAWGSGPVFTVGNATFPSTAVGQSTTQTVTVTVNTAVPVTSITIGANFTEYTINGITGCTVDPTGNTVVAAGSVCNISVKFAPALPGSATAPAPISRSAPLLVNDVESGTASGYSFALVGSATGAVFAMAPGYATDFAGDYTYVNNTRGCTNQTDPYGDGCPATDAYALATSMALDPAGNLYISDSPGYIVQRVDAKTGMITVFAGEPGVQGGYSSSGTLATKVAFYVPGAIAVDQAGNLYVKDTYQLWKINPATGIATIIGGDGSYSLAQAIAQGKTALQTSLAPYVGGMVVDPAGNIYLSTYSTGTVYRIDAVTDLISYVAGNGTPAFPATGVPGLAVNAQLDQLQQLAMDSNGNLYIADSGNALIYKVDTGGNISIFAGIQATGAQYNTECVDDSGDWGPATAAFVGFPSGVAVDAANNVYIGEPGDIDSGGCPVRRVDAATGVIHTVAGDTTGIYGFLNNAGATETTLQPYELAVDGGGNIFVGQHQLEGVVKIIPSQTALIFPYQSEYVASYQLVTASNVGIGTALDFSNYPFPITSSFTPPPFYNAPPTGTDPPDCSSGTLAAGAICSILVEFYPDSPTIFTATGTDTVEDNSLGLAGTSSVIALTGSAYNGATASLGPLAFGSQPVGSPTAVQPALFDIVLNPAITLESATISGTDASSFKLSAAPTSPCTPDLVIPSGGGSCNLGVIFNPQSSGPLSATLSLTWEGKGIPYTISETITGTGTAPPPPPPTPALIQFTPAEVYLVAGLNGSGYSGDNNPAIDAQLNEAEGLAYDSAGNLYIGDSYNYVVRKVDTSGIITTFAGSGNYGYSGDNLPAIDADFERVAGLAFDAAGDLYIADPRANVVRKVDTTGKITTVAGTGTAGYTGDGLAATAATLDMPWGLAFDSAGNLYIADELNQVVRIVDTTGKINTFAGNGFDHGSQNCGTFTPFTGAATSAQFCRPEGVAADANGNVYISDSGDNVVWVVNSGNISIFAGTGVGTGGPMGDGGPATSATLDGPDGLFVDQGGDLYVSDEGNSDIRKVDLTGKINTVFGNYNGGLAFKGSIGEPDTEIVFTGRGAESGANFMTLDPSGNIVVASTGAATVDQAGTTGDIYFTNQPVFTTQTYYLVIANPGGQPLTFSGVPTVSAPFGISGGTCDLTGTLAAGASCTVGVTFTPTVNQLYNGSFVLETNAAASPSTVKMFGTGTGVGVTSATLLPFVLNFTSSVGVPSAAQTVTLTNTGNYNLGYDGVSFNQPGFSETDNCPATLTPGAFCQYQVTFTPTAATTFSSGLYPNIPVFPGLYSVLDGAGTGPTATPVISPLATPTYNAPVAVEITDATPGSSILYSTDGTAPSVAYPKPFTVTASGTQVQALANVPFSYYTTSPTATSTYTIQPYLQFSSAQVEVAAPQLTATVSLMGSITPTATLHYGHDYSVGAVSCTPTSSSLTEVCTVPVTFTPTLPGPRKDALLLTSGQAIVATVMLGGTGQAPLSLVQPGAVSSLVAVTSNHYIYDSAVGEDGTVYYLANSTVYSEPKSGGAPTNLNITGLTSSNGSIAIDGAGTLYITQHAYSPNLITYNTVTGVQGTLDMIPPASVYTPCNNSGGLWALQGVAVDDLGDVFAGETLCGVVFELRSNGSWTVTALNPNNGPNGIAVDAPGFGTPPNIFATGNGGIDEITYQGQSQINTTGAGTIAVDAAETLYATGYNGGSPGVAELPASDPPFNYASDPPLAYLDPGNSEPLGVSVGSDGTLYVGGVSNLDKVDRTQGAIAFGEQSTGVTTATETVTIYNGGNETLTISNIVNSGAADGFAIQLPASSCYTTSTTFATVLAGQLCTIELKWTPSHAGNFSDSIAVTTNSLNTASTTQNIALTGYVYGVYLTVSPNPVPFGTEQTGIPSAAMTATVANSGFTCCGNPISASISSVSVPPGSAFTPTLGSGSGSCNGAVLNVGDSCQVSITFDPSLAQPYTDTVTVHSGTFGIPPVTFGVTGTGFTPTPTPTPVILPSAVPIYNTPVAVEIADSNTGANISYSTDGTAPSLDYPGPFTVTTSGTQVQALANSNGNSTSATASNTYTIQPYLNFGTQSVGSSQPAEATISLMGTTTPIPALHYGNDFHISDSVSCTPSASNLTEVCTVPITFTPTLPGARKDALFLTLNGTRIATVLLYGVGQAPFALVQPGNAPAIALATKNEVDMVVDDNDTVYALDPNNVELYSVTKAGVYTKLPIASGLNAVASGKTLDIDGAGVLYFHGQTNDSSIYTYDTVQGTEGTVTLPVQGSFDTVAIGNTGNVYAINLNGGVLYALTPDGGYTTTTLNAAYNYPDYMTVDSGENIFFANTGTIGELPHGGTQSEINTVGAPGGISSDAAGTLYTAGYPGFPGIAELPASNYSTALTSVDPGDNFTSGVAVAADGTVLYGRAGSGAAIAALDRSQGTINYYQQAQNTTSAPQNAGIYNGGNQDLIISNIAVSGAGFAIGAAATDNCSNGIVLAPGTFCQVAATFTPTVGGNYTGAVTFTSNSLNGVNTATLVNLFGYSNGINVVASTNPLNFPDQATGTQATQYVTLTNNGYGENANFIGNPSAGFGFSAGLGTCGGYLAVGASCQLSVTFAPFIAQPYSESVGQSFVGSTYGDHQSVSFAVNGTGTSSSAPVASLSPNPLAFTNQVVNTTSEAIIATLSNTGNASLSYSASMSGAAFASVTGANTCGTTGTLAAGSSCYIYVTFTPTSATSFSGNIQVTDTVNTPNDSPSIALSGTGIIFASQVGTTQATQAVTVNVATAGTLSAIQVLTQGTAGLDFALVSGGTCSTETAYTVGKTCTVNVAFTPAFPGSRPGAVILTDGVNNVLGTTYLPGTGFGPEVSFGSGAVTTLPTYSGGSYQAPLGVTVDAALNVYVADTLNGWIIKTPWTGSGYGTPTRIAQAGILNQPSTVAVDGSGNIFIADTDDFQIVEVPWNGSSYGNRVILDSSSLPDATGIVVDGNGNLFFSDGLNEHVFEMAWTGTGYASPVTLPQATGLHAPHGLAVDANLNLYIADSDDNQVVELPWTPGGFGAETVLATGLFYPQAVAVDAAGDVYIANTDANTVVELPFSGSSFGSQVTLPFSIGGTANGLALDSNGDVFVASGSGNDVLELTVSAPPSLTFASTNVGSTSSDSPKTVPVFNIGNTSLYIPIPTSGLNPSYPTDFPVNLNDGKLCEEDGSVNSGSSCDVSVDFMPTVSGPLTETVVLTDNSLNTNATQSIQVSGNGNAAPAVATPLIAPATGTYFTNQPVTITDSTDGAAICYTTDNSTPTASNGACTHGSTYSGSSNIVVSVTGTTVQAIGTFTGDTNSAVASATYTLQAVAPTLNPPGGTYVGAQQVALSTTTPGAQIWYTTNGTTPTGAAPSILYATTPISVTTSGTVINAIAVNTGYLNSSVSTGTYTLEFPAVTLTSPAAFPNTYAGSTATAQTATLSNTGNAPLTGIVITLAGANPTDFALATGSNACGTTLAAGSSCLIYVTFTPASVASFTANISVADNASGSPQTAALAGAGIAPPAPVASLTPPAAFPGTYTGSTASALTATLSNTGNAPLTGIAITLAGANPTDFALATGTNACGTTLAAGSNCLIYVTFTPASVATFTASIQVADNASGSPQTAALAGAGIAPPAPVASLTPPAAFPNTYAGSTATALTATLSNTGNAPLTGIAITLAGANPTDFALATGTNACGTTLAAGSSCLIYVTFTPASIATFTANISVADNAAGSPQTAAITGAGVAPPAPIASLSPATLAFPNTAAGSTAATLTTTLSNTGNATLTGIAISIGGANASDFSQTATTCGTTLEAGATCTISVSFTPASAASFTATLSVADNASGSPQTVALSGTGTTPNYTVVSPTLPQTVQPGGSATFTINVNPVNGNYTGVVTLTATGLPPGATATFAPPTVTPGSTGATSQMTIQTAAPVTTAAITGTAWPFAVPVLGCIGLFFVPGKRRRRWITLGVLTIASLSALTALSGCGGGFALTGSTSTSYTITVTGTSGADVQTTTVQLTVQ